MKKHTLFLMFLSATSLSLFGADQENASANTQQILLEGRDAAVVDQINAAQQFAHVATPFFSNPQVQTALIAARDRGVDVQVKVASRAKIRKLESAGVPVERVDNLHAKLVVTDQSAVIGSDNLSCVSAARKGELFVQTAVAKPGYSPIARSFNRITSQPKTSNITPKKATPKKPAVLSGHNGYKANRLKRFVSQPSDQNSIDVASMTFDSDRFVSEIEQTYAACPSDQQPTMRFFLDRSALKHPDLLERMQKAGGDKVNIFIYNTDGTRKIWDKFPDIMHQKFMARKVVKPDGTTEKHVIVSTGNVANRSENDINFDAHYPQNNEMHDQLVSLCDSYALRSEWSRYASQKNESRTAASSAAKSTLLTTEITPRRSARIAALAHKK